MKTLISMTDFVIQEWNRLSNTEEIATNLIRYAEFLKQPLTLGMFVPCGEDGNVLRDPGLIPSYELEQYRQAKERVLFEGFSTDGSYLCYSDFYVCKISSLNQFIIEDLFNLIPKNNYPTLTPYALKQIGL